VRGTEWDEGSFLALLDDDGRRRVLGVGSVADYQARQAIVREEDRSDFVAVIVAGRVCISRYVGSGREATLAIRGPGELVGEISALLDDVDGRSATVVALDPVRAHLLTRASFLDVLHREPAVMFATLRHLAHRLRGESARVEVSTGSSTRRVARLLVQRSVDAASEGRASVEVGAGLSQASIADLTGMSRESVVRALHRLRTEGSIRTGRQSIEVVDLSRLAAHAVDGA
jgi:CRP-like cAMP-binding protein